MQIAVGSRPAYFHGCGQRNAPNTGDPRPIANIQPAMDHSVGALLGDPPSDVADIDPQVMRVIVDAERRGFVVPTHIRSGDINAANRWYATLLNAKPAKP